MADLTVTATTVAALSGSVTSNPPKNAGVAVTAGQAAYVDGTGAVQLAKADTVPHAKAAGVVLNNAAVGQPAVLVTKGRYNPGATVVVGVVYCVSAANAGGICPISDLGAGAVVTPLGIADTTASINLNVWATGVTHA